MPSWSPIFQTNKGVTDSMFIIANKEYWCCGFKLSATGSPRVNLKPTLGRAVRDPMDPYEQVINSTKVTSAYYFKPYNKARDGFVQKSYSLHSIKLCETREECIDEYNRQVQAEIDKHQAIIDDCRKRFVPFC